MSQATSVSRPMVATADGLRVLYSSTHHTKSSPGLSQADTKRIEALKLFKVLEEFSQPVPIKYLADKVREAKIPFGKETENGPLKDLFGKKHKDEFILLSEKQENSGEVLYFVSERPGAKERLVAEAQGSGNSPSNFNLGLVKSLAKDERWHFGDKDDGTYPILDAHLRATMTRANFLGTFYCSNDGRYRVCSTNIVSDDYRLIYALWDAQKSKMGFFREGEAGVEQARATWRLYQQIFRTPLGNALTPPPRALYFDPRVVYNFRSGNLENFFCEIPYQPYHVLHVGESGRKNPYFDLFRHAKRWFPLCFLEKYGIRGITACDVNNGIEENIKVEINDALSEIIFESENAVKSDIYKACRIYCGASVNDIYWALPLKVCSDKPNLALIVALSSDATKYVSIEIAPLDLVYMGARVISSERPRWLPDPENIIPQFTQ